MKYNSDFKYDLKIGQLKEEELGNILNDKTVEVKYDLMALKTGNVYVEYESRGKKSGISTTKADYYCFVLDNTLHMIETGLLKDRCRKYINTIRDSRGGDSNSSRGIPLDELF